MSVFCPLCHGTNTRLHAVAHDIEYFTSDTAFDYVRCDACDILFVSPMLHDRLSEIYPSNYYSFAAGKAGLVQRVKDMLDRRMFRYLMRAIPGSSLNVLDVGGGTGWLLNSVKRSDERVKFTQIVDINPAAKILAEQAGHSYFLGPAEQFESSRKFDLILMLNLIEHVKSPDEILRKAAGLLSDGGLLLVKTPNFDALDARIFRNRSWGGYHAPRHFVLFNRESFARVASDSGLTVTSCAYTQGAPFWTVSALNELRMLGLVRLSSDRPSLKHPLTPLFQIAFASFDFLRAPFSKPSQMFVVLSRKR